MLRTLLAAWLIAYGASGDQSEFQSLKNGEKQRLIAKPVLFDETLFNEELGTTITQKKNICTKYTIFYRHCHGCQANPAEN